MACKNPLLKVVILGDGGVGKSCLMNRYISNHFDESSFHTIGVEFLSKEVEINGNNYTLQIWDTAGQERFKSLRTPFYRGSDICLLVYSIDDRRSFENLTMWKKEFLHYADVKDPIDFPFVILANKVDVPVEKHQVSADEMAVWCHENGDLPHLETSAKEAKNVAEAFSLAVKAWSSLEEKREPVYTTDTVDLSKHPSNVTQKSNCCSLKSESDRQF